MAAGKRVVALIVAMSRDGVIGANGRLPWRIPAELQRFKTLTMGHHIVMGRKTWESIGRLLPGRTTIVVSRNPGLRIEGALVVASLEQALAAAAGDSEIFVIGGADMFRLALPHADRIYLTTVDIECAGDTFMPAVDWSQWRRLRHESHAAEAATPGWVLEIYERSTPRDPAR
jgi:dihydrofolate reductase